MSYPSKHFILGNQNLFDPICRFYLILIALCTVASKSSHPDPSILLSARSVSPADRISPVCEGQRELGDRISWALARQALATHAVLIALMAGEIVYLLRN